MINDAEQASHYRDKLKQMLKQVPPSVLNGSFQRSVQYKEAVEHARKVLKTPNSVAKLSEACNRLASFY